MNTRKLNRRGTVISLRGHGHPIPDAYADADMNSECPHCGAPPHNWCSRADGLYRRIPCLARMIPSHTTVREAHPAHDHTEASA